MRKQKNTCKKWLRTETVWFISVTIKRAEFLRILSKTCKNGDLENNEDFPILNW